MILSMYSPARIDAFQNTNSTICLNAKCGLRKDESDSVHDCEREI